MYSHQSSLITDHQKLIIEIIVYLNISLYVNIDFNSSI